MINDTARTHSDGGVLTPTELTHLHAWWRAANYLSVGQIYLVDNPLLREPLQPEHIKPRLLGHWGTTPGLNFIDAHLNRSIIKRDLNMIYIMGPAMAVQARWRRDGWKGPTARPTQTWARTWRG